MSAPRCNVLAMLCEFDNKVDWELASLGADKPDAACYRKELEEFKREVLLAVQDVLASTPIVSVVYQMEGQKEGCLSVHVVDISEGMEWRVDCFPSFLYGCVVDSKLEFCPWEGHTFRWHNLLVNEAVDRGYWERRLEAVQGFLREEVTVPKLRMPEAPWI